MRTDLTTVVVNYNTVALLDDCLASILDTTPDGVVNQVVVVDNASSDGSVEHLRTHWPEVDVIANEANVGFCRANNQAIRRSKSPFLLLVNTDARLRPGGIAGLLGRFDTDDRAAVVGPRLEYADGTFQRWTAGRTPSLGSIAMFFTGLDRVTARLGDGPRPSGLYLSRDVDQAFSPDWVSSAVMALRRSALDEIGLLDENIFLYMDDVDLCHRAAAAGWTVWYEADTTATHFMGASSRAATGRVSPEALRALNRWYARTHHVRHGFALRGIEAGGFAARATAHGLRYLLSRDRSDRNNLSIHLANVRLALEPIHV